MTRGDTQRIDDMLQAINEIAEIVHRGRHAYDRDIALQRAIERCLEILGESSKTVSAETQDAINEVPWADLARVRDRLSHHYHRIDPDQVWTIATDNVPTVADVLREWRSSNP